MIDIEWNRVYRPLKVKKTRLFQLVQTICQQFSVETGTVSLAILDDEAMIALNKQFKNKDQTTDCFSFDLSDAEDGVSPRHFEILVNGQLAQREAQIRAHDAEAELALYITHALLHQLGFDDQTVVEAEKMHAREDEILQRFGYGMVYNRAEK